MKRTLAICAAIALSLSISACGGDKDAGSQASASSEAADAAATPTSGDVTISDQPLFDVAGKPGEEPTLTFSGNAPEGLQRYVMEENPDGAEVGPTDAVLAFYHGQVWDGKVFDSSYQRHEPVAFPLTGVIEGWQKGLTGTHVGDRVQLVIPPAQGYPDGTPDGSIKPGETIVFVVEVQDAASLSTPGDLDAKAENDPAAAGVSIERDDQGRLQSGSLLEKGADLDPMHPTVLFAGSDSATPEENDQVALRVVPLTSDQPEAQVEEELRIFQASQLPAADKLHVGSVIVAGEGKAGEMAKSAVIFEVVKIFKP